MAFPPRPRGTFNPRFKKEQQQEHRTNHMIRVPEVRLVGDNVEPGVYSKDEAQKVVANSLLKIIEEPPAKTIFMLVTSQADQLLTTILSRTQKIMVRAFSDEEIISYAESSRGGTASSIKWSV